MLLQGFLGGSQGPFVYTRPRVLVSRRDGIDHSAIAVVDRLAFLTEFCCKMAAIAVVNHLAVLAEVCIVIAVIDRRSFSAGFLVAITVQTKKTNEKSSELKFVLKFAVTFY